MLNIDQDLIAILKALNYHGVKYMIVGGYAFGLYAEPREKKDVDIWVKSDLENSKKIHSALLSCDANHGSIEDDGFVDKNNIFVIAFRRYFSSVLVKRMNASEKPSLKRPFLIANYCMLIIIKKITRWIVNACKINTPNQCRSVHHVKTHTVDIIIALRGLSFEEFYKRKNMVNINSVLVPFISREDLVYTKCLTGRPKDIADIEELKKIINSEPANTSAPLGSESKPIN